MKVLEKIRTTVDKVIDFLTEDVEEESKVEEVRKEVRKSAQQIEVMEKKIEAAEAKPAPAVAEKPVRPSEPTAFVNVGSSEKKPAQPQAVQPPVCPVEPIRQKESVYVPRSVISPIFGGSENSTQRYSTSPMVQYDEEEKSESVIGTIFSPINGRYVPAGQPDDEVSEDIARLTTTDFIEKIEPHSAEEEQPVMDAQYNTVSVQNIPVVPQPSEPVKARPIEQFVARKVEHVSQPSAPIVSDDPVIEPASDESDEGYENLRLF